ncbi:MAG TPA: hypothetical protein VLG37_00065 [Candidatus Saccharimonadales bacterium]|nr:hypothetical protein [Candidatus Saccharimonadales bacterium]
MFKNKLQVIVALIFLGFTFWWLSFQHIVSKQGPSAQWFEGTYGVMALIGAIVGFLAARKWGGFKTVLGKSLTLFSISLLAQEAGQLIYQYYIYKDKIAIPYPSLGDIAYFGSVLLYITASIFLARAVGVKFSLKSNKYKIIAIFVPVALLISSYWIFLYHHQYDTSHPITVFLDFGYPMGQAIYISVASVAYLLSWKMLGGIMKPGILLIILGLFVQYVSDFTFVFQSSRGTYIAGKFDDYFYLLAYFVMTIAMIRFHIIYKNLRSKNSSLDSNVTAKNEAVI